MFLTEALLRIPDSDTIDRLIRDKLTPTATSAPTKRLSAC
ncbi:MAG: hypothetical protein DIZ78_00365 [endosymbiont of Escarpia spicata]|uniref:Proline dehydrogenase PutA domain-containing protein n=1 Tax=endosymbiont of Escarpia spicata TaxID=2200908 RepID=A0A370DW33_9GAMM|nr:MAG: hypothetical protein DIZ78_00365 [endosymbiont of Escarpia spicata]